LHHSPFYLTGRSKSPINVSLVQSSCVYYGPNRTMTATDVQKNDIVITSNLSNCYRGIWRRRSREN
jgi:hypothetical protein